MRTSSKRAFTMIELVFVIVVIGILSAIAIPKFAATRDDAVITKAITTVASVRSALAVERQKRILRGSFATIGDLGDATYAFRYFDNNSSFLVLEYPVKNCTGTNRSCWNRASATSYVFKEPGGTDVTFTLNGVNRANRLDCTSNCGNFE
ncbi:type II secretion system protein [Sulfurovum sp. CS9]|uniref:type II secretion system protein n=1 Tax=Sulfurovum sp. CS9 TaxID=3391146 RepID=UPI0039EC4919